MKNRKALITTAGTLACAVGIGFFMQSTNSVPHAEYQGATLANADASVLDVEEIILTSAKIADDFIEPEPVETVTLAAAEVVVAPAAAATMPEAEPVSFSEPTPEIVAEAEAIPDLVCEISANARAVAAAMVNLTLSASCLPNERVTVHHAGMLFNESTNDAGDFDITVPALTTEATFVVAFTNGEDAVAQATVEELADFDRVAVQWKGDTGFELHAREYDADYGSDGHVWSGATRDMSYAVTGEGGFITRLGNAVVPDGLLAEVYTFPASTAQAVGGVALSVEAEVAENNCGLEIEAQTLQTFSGKDITSRDLTLSVPDCDAAGNFLVLNNLFEDLKVASN